jgi:hypothetical protein
MSFSNTRIAKASGILGIGFLLAWLSLGEIDIQYPPGPDPWYEYGGSWVTMFAILVGVFGAALFWFRASVFFSFGCLGALPLAIVIFYPDVHPVGVSVDTIHRAGWTTFAFCLLVGCASAAAGQLIANRAASWRVRTPEGRKALHAD